MVLTLGYNPLEPKGKEEGEGVRGDAERPKGRSHGPPWERVGKGKEEGEG